LFVGLELERTERLACIFVGRRLRSLFERRNLVWWQRRNVGWQCGAGHYGRRRWQQFRRRRRVEQQWFERQQRGKHVGQQLEWRE
jgi:hypothetical protein